MHIIEPCCSHRQMADLRKALGGGGRDQIRGFGDMSLTEMLPALLTSYNETEMLLAAPSIPDQAADAIATWMRWQWAKVDGSGKIYVLRRLTLIADLSGEKSPKASGWKKDNPWGGRLQIVDLAQDDTALLLPDIAITGPLNMRYGHDFTCEVTTVKKEVDSLWWSFSRLAGELSEKKPDEKDPVESPQAKSPDGAEPQAAAGAAAQTRVQRRIPRRR